MLFRSSRQGNFPPEAVVLVQLSSVLADLFRSIRLLQTSTVGHPAKSMAGMIRAPYNSEPRSGSNDQIRLMFAHISGDVIPPAQKITALHFS